MPSPQTKNGSKAVQTSRLQIETANAIAKWIERTDRPAGFHLTEHLLCATFNLSRSPIRAALQVLAEHGVVEKKPARGFYLTVSGRELGAREPILPDSRGDELYRDIAVAWFKGEIPDRVSTAELMRRYGSAETDVGRALSRLAADGIVERSAGKGWRFGANLATEKAFRDSYQFRMILEPQAILLDTFNLDRLLAARCRRRHEEILSDGHKATIREMVDADMEFHDMIAASCGNEFCAQTIRRHNMLRRLTEILTTPDGARLRASSAEHLGILEALEAGRNEVAAALMQAHLAVSKDFTPDFTEIKTTPGPQG